MDNKILNIVYTFFLGLILVLFIGLGISTFYPSPEAPQLPYETAGKSFEDQSESERQKSDALYQTAWEEYQDKEEIYSRNVSMIVLGFSILLLAISFLFEKRNQVIANGVLLGGLFTLTYSVIRGFISTDTKYTFIAVTVGLIIVLYLGYRRFAHTPVARNK